MTTMLRDGTTTEDRRLDRLVLFDEKSRNFPVLATIGEKPPRSHSWRCDVHLDQGREGACAEFAATHDLLAVPVPVDVALCREIVRLHAIYWPAQRDDPWPGGSYPGAAPQYDGTAVLAVLKRLQALGFVEGYRWAFGLRDVILALGYTGPVIFGLNWLREMFSPDERGWIRAQGPVEGGHCVLGKAVRLVWLKGATTAQKRSPGWLEHLDLDASFVTLHQSWGEDHGDGGDVYISLRDLDLLLQQDGEAAVVVGRRKTPKIPLDA